MKHFTFLGTVALLAVFHSGFTQVPPRCAAVTCRRIACDRPLTTPPGECCPICPPDCSAVSCLRPACDRALITPPGQCCSICPATEDCSKVLCQKPMCSNPSTPKGECCPVCPTCLAVLCPKPDCDKPVFPPGECCGVCPKPTFCLHNGRKYPIGSWVPTGNPCQYCSCRSDGEVHCAIRRCPRLPCDNPVNVPGQCCAVCPRPTVCVVGNKKYRIGSRVPPQRPCTNCFCGYDGRVRCYPVRCPKLTCDNPRTIKGRCCPVCPTPGICIADDGKKYRAGQSVPNSDPCKHCTCLQSGEILCAIQDCARPTCENPVRIDGRCCPVCPPPGVCIGKDGTRYSAGDSVPSTNPCAICTCGRDSSIDCPIRDCPRPSCANPISVPGKCCPVCPEEETCVKDGVKYKVGEPIPDDNPCLGCACEKGGKLMCYMRDCARPPCSRPVSVAGRCCPVCLKTDLEI